MNSQLKFLTSRIIGVPLLITEAKLKAILDVLNIRVGMDIDNIEELGLRTVLKTQSSIPSHGVEVPKGVGVVPIHGTLTHRSGGINALSGLTSYNQIRSDFQDAMANPEVDTVLLDIDSHGGEVAGCFDLVDEIHASRGQKPIVAVIDEAGYSAAYAIASAADKVYVNRTAGVGSIGVVMVHADRSEQEARAGVKYTTIYAGDRKADFSPHAPLSDEAKAAGQKQVNDAYNIFVSTVARNNGLSESEVIKTQAATYNGQDAVSAGLADAVMTYQEVINSISEKGGTQTMAIRNAKVNEPVVTEPDPEPIVETPEPDSVVTTPEPDPVIETPDPEPQVIEPGNTVTLTADPVQAERDRVIQIIEACQLAEAPEMATTFINDGVSMDVVNSTLMTVLAQRTEATKIITSVDPGNCSARNPLLENAKKRAKGEDY
ncbi:MAG: S49 family peptidase [Phycisphaerales bacterium]|jgi:signal peptide peptidase SppA